jgi:alpha-L-rhamnosidase
MAGKFETIGRRGFLQGGVGLTSLAVSQASLAKPRDGSVRINALSIEWQSNPLAVDTLQPRFHWALAAVSRKVRDVRQTGYRLVIAERLGERRQILDTGLTRAADTSFRPAQPLPLKSQTRYVATLTVQDVSGTSTKFASHFTTGLLSPSHVRAKWIAAEPDRDDHYQAIEGHWKHVDIAQPMPVFQKGFSLQRQPVQAHLVIVGLGQYQLLLNGKQVSPEGVNGGWTNYNKHVLYDAYDVTNRLSVGAHNLTVELGNGFFNVEAVKGRYSKLSGRFGQPQALVQLRLVYADGEEAWINSDASWQTATGGTTYSSIYGGEDFDVVQADRLFSNPHLWRPVNVVSGPSGALAASTFAPMILKRRLPPKSVNAAAPGGAIYDFGLNHSGRPRLRVTGAKPGTTITLIPSELVGADGGPDQASMAGGGEPGLRGIEFNYVCKGGTEEWVPQFTYTGYRYVQLRGIPADAVVLESEFLSDDLAEAGSFKTSDAKLQSVHGLIHQALLSNSASVLTDCPTREKLGWLEQIYLNAATTMNNLDAVRLYEKMCRDMRDAQEANGMVPAIAPEYIQFLDDKGQNTRFRDSPEWGAALTLATWYAFQRYGDTGILEQNYDAIKARLGYLETRLEADGLLNFGLGDWYDIGPDKPGYAQLTSLQMTGTATFYAELDVMAQISVRLERPEAVRYTDRARALKATLQARLFHAETSTYDTGSQTAQAIGLVLDLFPQDHRAKALELLVADIRKHSNHVTAGDIGFHYVVRALSDAGRSDVLYDLLSQTSKPSYLEQVANGATALTEAWDSWREASQNHFMLGHAEIWFFQGLGGLQVDHSRVDDIKVIIAPQLVTGIDRTAVTSQTLGGIFSCETRQSGGVAQVLVTVPAGQRAEIRLPFTDLRSVRENGLPLEGRPGITTKTSTAATVIVGSGTYAFAGHTA